MMFRLAAVTAGLVLAGSCGALAQPAATGPLFISPAGEPFRTADPLRVWFDGADADKDGKLVRNEFLADHDRFFGIADTNKNDVLAGVDVTIYEYRTVPEILAPDKPQPRKRTPSSGGGAGQWSSSNDGSNPISGKKPKLTAPEFRTGAGRYSLLNEPQPIRSGDADIDFQVTREEWAAAARRRFERLDTNKDDALTLEELEPRLP